MKKIKRTAAEKKQIALEIIGMFSSEDEMVRNRGIILLSTLDKPCYVYFLQEINRHLQEVKKSTSLELITARFESNFFDNRWNIRFQVYVDDDKSKIHFTTWNEKGGRRKSIDLSDSLSYGWFKSCFEEEFEYLIKLKKLN